MDLGTLVGALSSDEREELLTRLTAEAEEGSDSVDVEHASGCCGGAGHGERHRARRSEMRHACCGG